MGTYRSGYSALNLVLSIVSIHITLLIATHEHPSRAT